MSKRFALVMLLVMLAACSRSNAPLNDGARASLAPGLRSGGGAAVTFGRMPPPTAPPPSPTPYPSPIAAVALGSVAWHTSLAGSTQYEVSAVTVGSKLIVSASPGLVAYDRDSGRRLWARTLPPAHLVSNGSDVYGLATQAWTSNERPGYSQLITFDPGTGRTLWSAPVTEGVVVADEMGPIAFGREVIAFDRFGHVLWRRPSEGGYHDVVFRAGSILATATRDGASLHGVLEMIDRRTGDLQGTAPSIERILDVSDDSVLAQNDPFGDMDYFCCSAQLDRVNLRRTHLPAGAPAISAVASFDVDASTVAPDVEQNIHRKPTCYEDVEGIASAQPLFATFERLGNATLFFAAGRLYEITGRGPVLRFADICPVGDAHHDEIVVTRSHEIDALRWSRGRLERSKLLPIDRGSWDAIVETPRAAFVIVGDWLYGIDALRGVHRWHVVCSGRWQYAAAAADATYLVCTDRRPHQQIRTLYALVGPKHGTVNVATVPTLAQVEEQILAVEGFRVRFEPLSPKTKSIPSYDFTTMAPQRWKISDWKNARLKAYVALLRGVTIARGDGTAVKGDLQLGSLRDSYYAAHYGSLEPPQ